MPERQDERRAAVHFLAEAGAPVSTMPETAERRAEGLLALMERPAWHKRASCRGVEGFFDLDPLRAIALHCLDCPVIWHCRAAGEQESFGIWAGERKQGFPESGDTVAGRILAAVHAQPFELTANELRHAVRGGQAHKTKAIAGLLAAGRLCRRPVLRATNGGGQTSIVYGPGDERIEVSV